MVVIQMGFSITGSRLTLLQLLQAKHIAGEQPTSTHHWSTAIEIKIEITKAVAIAGQVG